jgi:hypothetical protein
MEEARMMSGIRDAVPPVQLRPELGGRSSEELMLSLGVLVFGLIVIGAEVAVMLKRKVGWGPAGTQIVGLTIVAVAGMFLITAGYTSDQIAPMIGLLGTIAGYLLGKSTQGST